MKFTDTSLIKILNRVMPRTVLWGTLLLTSTSFQINVSHFSQQFCWYFSFTQKKHYQSIVSVLIPSDSSLIQSLLGHILSIAFAKSTKILFTENLCLWVWSQGWDDKVWSKFGTNAVFSKVTALSTVISLWILEKMSFLHSIVLKAFFFYS